MSRFKANVLIHGKIRCMTGVHIGDGSAGGAGGLGFGTGGIDYSVVRDPISDYPYIPGSSIKGRMRSLLESAMGKITTGGDVYTGRHGRVQDDDPILRIFGTPIDYDRRIIAGPACLLVRDARPDGTTKKMMDEIEIKLGLPKVEVKSEVALNRITSRIEKGRRRIERIPAGSLFDFEMLFSISDRDKRSVDDIDLIDHFFLAMRLVEETSLGGGGSRGSGRIEFYLGSPVIRSVHDYRAGRHIKKSPESSETLEQFKPLTEYSENDITALKTEIRAKL